MSAVALVAGLAAATVAQGGFHLVGRVPLLVGISLALLICLRVEGLRRSELRRAPVVLLLALAAWCLLRGATGDSPLSGLEPALLALGLAGVTLAVSRYDRTAREVLLVGLLGIGVLLAVTGWAGVVWHLPRLAVSQDGLWRAGSTLTYSNAAAAALAPLVLVLLARLSREPSSRQLNGVAALLLTGFAATLSRAGVLALCAGLVVLAATLGWRSVARALVAPGAGAVVAVLGLMPSTALDSAAGRPVALVALPAGVLLAGWLAGLRHPALVVSGLGVVAGVALWLGGYAASVPQTFAIRRASPPARGDMHEAALDQLRESPIIGVGPEHSLLTWTASDGSRMAVPFVHDEYVQVLMELGAIGLALVVALLAALASQTVRCVSGLPGSPDSLACGALAALAAFVVHSGFDFVWHLPVLPLIVVALVAVAVHSTQEPTERSNP